MKQVFSEKKLFYLEDLLRSYSTICYSRPPRNTQRKEITEVVSSFFLQKKVGLPPTDLDVSGGHSSVTQHNSNGEYHYHIINEFYTGSYILLFGGEDQGTPSDIN